LLASRTISIPGIGSSSHRIHRRASRVIAWALDHRWWVMLIAAPTFVGSLVLQGLFQGSGFVPVSDPKYR
jgi:Cation/multidrug efflux pump